MENIAVIIPARSGSKSLPHKNIKSYHGHPLLAHSILLCKKSEYILPSNIFLLTDSEEYAAIGRDYGAQIPFIRPSNISNDLSTDYELFEYFMEHYQEAYRFEYIIQLRPTYPNRSVQLLNNTIHTILRNPEYDSLRTVIPTDMLPYKMYHIQTEKNELIPIFETYHHIKEPYNQPRQLFPQTFIHNGCIDIFKTSTLLEKKSITGNKIYPYIMNENEYHDIDTENDFYESENVSIFE